jgi:hypothetical protein
MTYCFTTFLSCRFVREHNQRTTVSARTLTHADGTATGCDRKLLKTIEFQMEKEVGDGMFRPLQI